MGRFGNVFLVGGETGPETRRKRGEIIRFYLTNTANTRVFNVAFAGARDEARRRRQRPLRARGVRRSVVLAPSERAVVDVLFERAGQLVLEHRTPERTYSLATIEVAGEPAAPRLAQQFPLLRQNPEWAAMRERLAPYFDAPPDKTLALRRRDGRWACPRGRSSTPARCTQTSSARRRTLPEMRDEADRRHPPSDYVCPMHPDVVSDYARPLPEVRHEAAPCRARRTAASTRATAATHEHDAASTRHHGHGARQTATTSHAGHNESVHAHEHAHERRTTTKRTRPAAGSNGRTTWSTSTG